MTAALAAWGYVVVPRREPDEAQPRKPAACAWPSSTAGSSRRPRRRGGPVPGVPAPIVVRSTAADEGEAEHFGRAGSAVLMPPFQLRALRTALAAVILEGGGRMTARTTAHDRRRRAGHPRRGVASPNAPDSRLTCRGRDAIALMQARRADLVMVDLRMPEVGGLDILRAIRDVDAHCQAVLMTGYASVDTAVEAVKLGAMDYLSKPLDFGRLEQLLAGVRDEIIGGERALDRGRPRAPPRVLRHDWPRPADAGPLRDDPAPGAARPPRPRHGRDRHRQGAGGARPPQRSARARDRRFVAVNCSAVDETLFESELFGHVRGGFTGATESKPGLFELADGGTLFLDEIGELPPTAQAKLLRVLELGEVTRVGRARHAATSTSAWSPRRTATCAAEVAAERFRGDLFYRLNVVEVKLPPLRERREDIPYLTAAFVREIGERLQKPLPA